MIKDNFVDQEIGKRLLAENDEERKGHVSSGKLSASILNDPIQWQVLKTLGVEGKPIDEYVIRKFRRGKDIESWLVDFLKPVDKQKFVEYRNTVGYIDAVVDTKDWQFPVGVIPAEIKSVSNAKFKRILKQGADKGHLLQGAFYGICLNSPKFALCYVASDDLRVETYIYDTDDFKSEIDAIIDKFEEQIKSKVVPIFEARETWQSNEEYCRYPELMDKTADELAELFKDKWKKKN
jgi:hypothetical protein